MIFYWKHYSYVDKIKWTWKNFTPQELSSSDNGELKIDTISLTMLQLVRDTINTPLIISSAYRNPIYNAKIGGAPRSRHKFGDAYDIKIYNLNKFELLEICKKVGFTGFGFYNTFLHIDTWTPRQWGVNWFNSD